MSRARSTLGSTVAAAASWLEPVRARALSLSLLLLSLASALGLVAQVWAAKSQKTTRVSVSSAGAGGNGTSDLPSISASGRYVAFDSHASNLVRGDRNGDQDVFVRDRRTGTTTRVNVTSDGAEVNQGGIDPSISAGGRFVSFSSHASNLVRDDRNRRMDVFVHDRRTGRTIRVSVSSAGTEAEGESDRPSISANGRYVAFVSDASNLVNGDRNSDFSDVFVHDRRTRRTTRVSLSSAEKEANAGDPYYQAQPSISANGRFVAFGSGASNLVTGDHNGVFDAFVRDRETGKTTRVSISSAGAEGNRDSYLPSIAASGRFVAFSSGAGGLVTGDHNGGFDVFVRDRRTGKTTRVSVNSAEQEAYSQDPVLGVYSQGPSISANGRYIAFYSNASNLVRADRNGVPDVFVRDRWTGRTSRVSLSSAKAEANGFSGRPSISADARFVAFVSDAANLMDGDRNRRQDIFVRGPLR